MGWTGVYGDFDAAAPAFTLSSGQADHLALAAAGHELLIGRSSDTAPLERWTGAFGIAAPTLADTVPAAAFEGALPLTDPALDVGPLGDLWLSSGRVERFAGAQTVGAASTFDGAFVDTVSPSFTASSYDDAGDRLFVANAGGGISVLESPAVVVGTSVAADFQLEATDPFIDVVVVGGRLFALSPNAPHVRMWSDVSAVSAPISPDVTLGTAVPGLTNPLDLDVYGSSLAVATAAEHQAAGSVLLWRDVSLLGTDQSADATFSDAAIPDPRQVLLGAGDRMFVRHGAGACAVDASGSVPTVVSKVSAASPTDMQLVECAQDADCSGVCIDGRCR